MFDDPVFGITVNVIRGRACAKCKRVRGVADVQLQVTEVAIHLSIRLGKLSGSCVAVRWFLFFLFAGCIQEAGTKMFIVAKTSCQFIT